MECATSFGMEVWRKIAEFPDYSVSDQGRIRRDKAGCGARVGRILKYNPTTTGYLMVQLFKDSRPHPQLVSRLVAKAFIGEPPEGKTDAAHADGDKSNNYVANLRWATRRENETDKFRHGTDSAGSKNGMAKLDEQKVRWIKRRLSAGESYKDIAAVFGVNRASINYIAIGRTWKHVQ